MLLGSWLSSGSDPIYDVGIRPPALILAVAIVLAWITSGGNLLLRANNPESLLVIWDHHLVPDARKLSAMDIPGPYRNQSFMNEVISLAAETGLEVIDIRNDASFAARTTHKRNSTALFEGMQRIARAFVDRPETILQELVDVAVQLCSADSAGISLEKENGTDRDFYHWVATAGQYSGFLNAVLPRYPSACGVCLERGRPQMFRVGQRFFDLMGIEAPLVTDGILLPWQAEEARGTIFIMAHGRTEAFDLEDCRLMEVLADFASMGIRQRHQQELLLVKTNAEAAASMANELAHKINNPLQSLTNVFYLAAEGQNGEEAKAVGRQALEDLQRLSALVKELLALPRRNCSK